MRWNLLWWRYININCIAFPWPVLHLGIRSFWTLSILFSSKRKAMFQTKRILWVLRRDGWRVPKDLRPRERAVFEVRARTTDPELKIVLSTGSLWECVSLPFPQTRENFQFLESDVWLTVLPNSLWIRNQLHVTYVLSFIISPLQVAQHVSGNHMPIFRSWRLRSVIVTCWCCAVAAGRLSEPVSR